MYRNKQITRSSERGRTQMGWLDSYHSFSFGGHYDPERMGFGPLRVVNEDIIAPKGGFPPHPHKDMEIVTIILDGALEHKDSMGNGRVIRPGEIQYMSAGTGVTHSEFNPSDDKPVHLMQIWIQPNAQGLSPAYADQQLVGAKEDVWSLVLSPDGREGSMAIRQDAQLVTVQLTPNTTIDYASDKSGRGYWVFVIEGEVSNDAFTLGKGDSVALPGGEALSLKNTGLAAAKVLLFDLPLSAAG